MCLGKPSYSPNISTIIYMVWSGATLHSWERETARRIAPGTIEVVSPCDKSAVELGRSFGFHHLSRTYPPSIQS